MPVRLPVKLWADIEPIPQRAAPVTTEARHLSLADRVAIAPTPAKYARPPLFGAYAHRVRSAFSTKSSAPTCLAHPPLGPFAHPSNTPSPPLMRQFSGDIRPQTLARSNPRRFPTPIELLSAQDNLRTTCIHTVLRYDLLSVDRFGRPVLG
jgi:hypothetical protein